MTSLFGYLVGRFATHPENLAIEALAYTLRNSRTARLAFVAHLSEFVPSLPTDLLFRTLPWSKRLEIPDPQVLDAADQYEEARKLLAEQPPGSGVLLPLMNTAAMAVELYLKCLSAELIHVEDEQMPEVSCVYAASAITSGQGHDLVALLNVMPPDVRRSLINAFDAELRNRWNKDLQCVLAELEGAFLATRYPFEQGIDITRYNLKHLMGLADFLGRFARSVSPTERIEWK